MEKISNYFISLFETWKITELKIIIPLSLLLILGYILYMINKNKLSLLLCLISFFGFIASYFVFQSIYILGIVVLILIFFTVKF